jgi:hypothetical protein
VFYECPPVAKWCFAFWAFFTGVFVNSTPRKRCLQISPWCLGMPTGV